MDMYKIELERFGITEGPIEKQPDGTYTAEQYNTVKRNAEGLNAALQYAHDNGFGGMRMPYKGVFCFPIDLNSDNTFPSPVIIIHYDNFKFDLNSSRFEVIFDSDHRSPDCAKPANVLPHQVGGSLIFVSCCCNVTVCNGELKGDAYRRSWRDGNERRNEGTYGLLVGGFAENITVENMSIHGFMGDGVSASPCVAVEYGSHAMAKYHMVNKKPEELSAGELQDDGTVKDVAGSCYTGLLKVDDLYSDGKYCANWPYKNLFEIGHNSGYTRIPDNEDPMIEVLYFDTSVSSTKPTRREYKEYLSTCQRRENEDAVRFQLRNEVYKDKALDGAPDTYTQPVISLSVRSYEGGRRKFSNLKVYNNHRGGTSAIGKDSVICDCEYFNNGMDCGCGAPLFPDSTRYQIDFEDMYVRNVVIERNYFHDGYNCLLMGVYSVFIRDNVFENMQAGGVEIYNNKFAEITGNVFTNSKFVSAVEFGKSPRDTGRGGMLLHRVINARDNYVYSPNGQMRLTKMYRTTMVIENNHIDLMALASVDLGDSESRVILKGNWITLHMPYYRIGGRGFYSSGNVIKYVPAQGKPAKGWVEYHVSETVNDRFTGGFEPSLDWAALNVDGFRSDGGRVTLVTGNTVQRSGMLTVDYRNCDFEINPVSISGSVVTNLEITLNFFNCTIRGLMEMTSPFNYSKLQMNFVNCHFAENFSLRYNYMYNENFFFSVKDCKFDRNPKEVFQGMVNLDEVK